MHDNEGIEDDLLCARELYRAGQYAGVVAVCTQALERSPMDPELLLERACAWIALWRPDQAYADLHEVLLVDATCVRAYHVLGQLLLQSGKLTGARDAYRRALALAPQDEPALAALLAVEARLAEVTRSAPDGAPRRPSAPQLVRAGEPARAHRRFATSPTGSPISTLTALIRRAPSAAPHVVSSPSHRRQINDAAPTAARGRDKTAPYRMAAGGRVRAITGAHAISGAHGRAPTAPISHAPSAPMASTSTQPIARAATQPPPELPAAAPDMIE